MNIYRNAAAATILNMDEIVQVVVHPKLIYLNQP